MLGSRRQPRKIIATLAHQAAQTAALGAQHNRNARAKIERRQQLGRGFLKTTHPKRRFLHLVERSREINHADKGHAFEGARGGLGERSGNRWRAARGEDYAERAKSGRRAQHGPEILRIADPVEDDDHAFVGNSVGQLQQPFDVGLRERLHSESQSLMDGAIGQDAKKPLVVQHLDRRTLAYLSRLRRGK